MGATFFWFLGISVCLVALQVTEVLCQGPYGGLKVEHSLSELGKLEAVSELSELSTTTESNEGNFPDLLKTVVEKLYDFSDAVNSSKFSVLDLVAAPQQEVYKVIDDVIDDIVSAILSVVDTVLGENNIISNSTEEILNCAKSSSEDILAQIEEALVSCFSDDIQQTIELVAQFCEDLGDGIDVFVSGGEDLLSFNLTSLATGPLSGSVGLVVKIGKDLFGIIDLLGSVTAGIPMCLAEAVSVTPLEAITDIGKNFFECFT